MSFFQLGREIYNNDGVSKVAVAVDKETAKIIVDALNTAQHRAQRTGQVCTCPGKPTENYIVGSECNVCGLPRR